MKKNFLPLILIIVLSFTFCKKKSSTPEPAAIDNNSHTNGTYSNLQTSYVISDYNHVITKDSLVFASFYDQPPTTSAPNSILAGNVSLNSTSLTPFSNVYMSSSPINISGTLNWSVAGSGTVTAFTYSYLANYPKYTGASVLPDTCIKANGITITISGISNHIATTGVTVILSQSTSIVKYILGNSGNITFSASELAGFSANSSISIEVLVSNYTTAILGEVKHGFSCGLQYTKNSYLK